MISTKINFTLPNPQGTPCGYPGGWAGAGMWKDIYLLPVVIILFTFMLSFIFSACASGPSTNTSGNPLGLLVPGTLTVASDISNPPFEFINDRTQQPSGFDLELISAIGQRLGLKINIVNTKIELLVSDLENERYDVAIGALPITPDLQARANTIPYYTEGESLLVQAGNPHQIHALADVCGQAVGVQDGSRAQVDLQNASVLCLQHGKPAISFTVLKNQLQLAQLLAAQRVVATFQNSATSDYLLHLYPGQYAPGSPILNASAVGIAVQKGNVALTSAIQATLNTLKSDGTYARLLATWGLMKRN